MKNRDIITLCVLAVKKIPVESEKVCGVNVHLVAQLTWNHPPVTMLPPTNQQPTLYRPDVLPVTQPTVSNH